MQIAYSAAALLALACSVLAADPTSGFDPISAPAKDQELVAGETATITWQAAPAKYDEETISIYLMAGKSPSTLQVEAEPIVSGITNKLGTYDWAVDEDLGAQATYGLKIVLDSDTTIFQYSFPFKIQGGEPSGNDTNTSGPTATKTDSSDSTPTKASNSSATTGAPKSTVTSVVGGGPGGGSGSRPTTSSPGAGAQATAGSLALLGGLALAALAL